MAKNRLGDLGHTKRKKSCLARSYNPMYLPANWFRIVVRWIQEIAVVYRRRRRSPRRPRAALRVADQQHFRPTILERAACTTFADSPVLHRLLQGYK